MIPNQAQKNVLLLRIAIGIIIALLVAAILLADRVISEQKKLRERIFPNVYIDNINVGEKTKKEAVKFFSKKYEPLQKVSLTVLFNNESIATFSAAQLGLKANISDVVDRAYLIGRVSLLSARIQQKFITLFNRGRYDFETRISYDKSAVDEFLSDAEQQYNVPAKNALFEFENNRVVTFRPEEKGITLKSDEFRKKLDTTIADFKNKPQSKALILEKTVSDPELTLAKANQFGIEELIGVGKSNYTHSIPERVHNVLLASSKFHGVLIQKGEEFSFNKIVGDISAATGYQPAYIIKSGKTVLGDGGGVCQVSTTLFRAALNSGLPIVERVAHAYRVGYYENDSKPGFDATVFSPYADFKFKNDTPAAILIQMVVNKNTNELTFEFYGRKDGRQIFISQPTLYDVQPPPPPLYQDDPTIKRGVTKQVDFAAWGGKTNFSYKVARDGQILFEKNFYSSYRPWQAVYLVGTVD